MGWNVLGVSYKNHVPFKISCSGIFVSMFNKQLYGGTYMSKHAECFSRMNPF